MASYPSSGLQGSYAYSDTLKAVHFGPGSTAGVLPKLLEELKGTRALIVTGKSLRTKTDIVTKIENILKSRNAFGGTFSDIGEHSPISGIRSGVVMLKESNSDIIVSVGGGSPIDASKAIIYLLQEEKGGEFMKQIALPTTLSAAEYTIGAGYTNEKGHKAALTSPYLAPAGIILDAELTLPTPERLWLSTGIRALDHAVENLYRAGVPLPLRILCYAAIKDLFTYLPKSKERPEDVEVRQKLQLASWMSLWPLKLEKYSALGLSHALGHRLGATYGIGHGITSCLTLSPVINMKATTASESDKKFLAEILPWLDIPSTGSLEGDVRRVAEEIDRLVRSLGLNTNLKECGVPREDLEGLASVARHLPSDANHFNEVLKFLETLYS